MADVFVGSDSNQVRGSFKCQQLGIRSVLIWFSDDLKQVHSMSHQEDGNKQKQPRNELVKGEQVFGPMRSIKQDKSQDGLPRKEPGEAMRVRAEQRFPGDINKISGDDGKSKQSEHFVFLMLQRPGCGALKGGANLFSQLA